MNACELFPTSVNEVNTFSGAFTDESAVIGSTFVQATSEWGVNITTVMLSSVDVTDNSLIPTSASSF